MWKNFGRAKKVANKLWWHVSFRKQKKKPKKNFSFPNLSEASLAVLTHQSVNVTYLAHVFLFLYPKLCLWKKTCLTSQQEFCLWLKIEFFLVAEGWFLYPCLVYTKVSVVFLLLSLRFFCGGLEATMTTGHGWGERGARVFLFEAVRPLGYYSQASRPRHGILGGEALHYCRQPPLVFKMPKSQWTHRVFVL